MNEKIDLNDMRLFVAVVRAGSLSKASELLGVSKSRLSRRLTGLENALGTTLLDRGRRGILLNELGTQFFQQAEAMLQCAEQAVAGVQRGLDEPRGRLRIFISTEILRDVLAPHLGDYLRRYPAVNMEVQTQNAPVNMIQTGIDVAFRMGDLRSNDMVARKIREWRLGLYATAPYLAEYPPIVIPEDLEQHQLLQKYDGPEWVLHKNQRHVVVHGAKRLLSNDFNLLEKLVEAHQGIALLPEYMARHGMWQRILPDWQIESVPLHLLYYKNRGGVPVIRSFVEFVSAQIQKSADI